ncbi:MAG: hypothetical protein KJ072_22050, partial [Verrucomicrobia bacterium]|nr:hypothetical protein [Verrucomicrobiota bacterium]
RRLALEAANGQSAVGSWGHGFARPDGRLGGYWTHARSVIPELTQIANYFEKDEKDFPKELMLMKAKCVRETMVAIEASTDTPELSRLE